MANNVLINGRSAVHAGSQGTLNTVDVCLTPSGNSVVPIPYPNVARSADADKTAGSVYVNGNAMCHIKSVFKKSTGDQPGRRKGVVSGKIKGEASFVSASGNVFAEGQAVTRALDMMVSNNKNPPPPPLMQPVGMPPLPTRPKAPNELEPEGPDRINAIIQGDPGEGMGVLIGESDD